MSITFEAFPKLGRLSRTVVVTEKIDGTNASVIISDDGQIGAGSRNRLITPENDNFGFAAWVQDNREQLLALGPGRHFGEWWGAGIQRRYGLQEKRFSLFNVGRWNEDNPPPACCHVVPVLGRYTFDTTYIEVVMDKLKEHGSYAAPGFMDPEGVVIFHTANGALFKKTFVGDAEGKGRKPLAA